MSSTPELITEDGLRELARANSVQALQARRAGDRYALVARIGMGERTLRSRREEVRTWANLNTLARYVREKLGIGRFEVVG